MATARYVNRHREGSMSDVQTTFQLMQAFEAAMTELCAALAIEEPTIAEAFARGLARREKTYPDKQKKTRELLAAWRTVLLKMH